MNFGTVLTAMVTPFDENGKINYLKAQELALHLLDNGSDGVVLSGTTGEGSTLTFQEKINLIKSVKDAVGSRGKILAGTGGNDTETSVELTKESSKLGIDGVMVVVPYYNKPSQEGLYQHFKALAQCCELPVMLYNVPSRTGINLQPETVERLAEITNITSIKEALGSMDQVTELRKRLGSDFCIYSGDDSLTLPILALGGSGVVSVAGHLVGKQIKEMVEKFLQGDTVGALSQHTALFGLFKKLFITTNPIPVKTALNLMGWNLGSFRLPLTAATSAETAVLEEMLREFGLK